MSQKKNVSSPAINLVAGGTAGLFEALCCHPLDTIKVRMQIHKKISLGNIKNPGFLKTGSNIYRNEGFIALYKGLGAVVIGIIPKMAIRFSSYEQYRSLLTDKSTGKLSTGNTFIAGVGAGITEAVIVVNPMEVVKIRLQAQHLAAPVKQMAQTVASPVTLAATSEGIVQTSAATTATAGAATSAATTTAATNAAPRYKNAIHAAYTIVKEEGAGTLYRGVSLTAARQATNQGANFTVYSKLKEYLTKKQNTEVLPSWQTSSIGLVSGAIGPFSNAPLDTIKTRLQKDKSVSKIKTSSWKKIYDIGVQLVKEEGVAALYKGITPRVMRVAPGQAVTFTVYEFVRKRLEDSGVLTSKPKQMKNI
ncbi:hypothetical protein TPHA_0B01350 [Tetrapisispora phaffii CBS 4417]|uniref:Mitochondrial succinate-fumarate transporter n=1 Tax=Tetrapisispora phaffii (strain ATCC 24235 / CBS 4417 / NBRC 1672 / NRRL Y-8282 / UCD 70-5) TaxID=1071381 RepID=G8BP77_TETPH|nr:hypothetical protein TPHA_0B01350 [Tetrapisispora phaffii CBS 4417]CCE61808.1 hypothetical protein TPHA_0B01350 [Tetrapisispora phaffii CBS 4417]